MAQTGPGSVVSDGDALQYTATAFNGADLETGSIFSKDDDMAPEDERWRKRFRRRVKVRVLQALAVHHVFQTADRSQVAPLG